MVSLYLLVAMSSLSRLAVIRPEKVPSMAVIPVKVPPMAVTCPFTTLKLGPDQKSPWRLNFVRASCGLVPPNHSGYCCPAPPPKAP